MQAEILLDTVFSGQKETDCIYAEGFNCPLTLHKGDSYAGKEIACSLDISRRLLDSTLFFTAVVVAHSYTNRWGLLLHLVFRAERVTSQAQTSTKFSLFLTPLQPTKLERLFYTSASAISGAILVFAAGSTILFERNSFE